MKKIILMIVLSLCVVACGKKPGTLTPVAAPSGQSRLAQPYPMIQAAPPVDSTTPSH